MADIGGAPQAAERHRGDHFLHRFRRRRQTRHALCPVDRPRHDGIDAHAVPAPFLRQGAGHHVDARLGCRDMRLRLHRQEGLRRRNADDAGAGFLEIRERGAHDMKGAEQIDFQHAAKGVRRHAVHRRRKVPRRAGDQHVERAERRMNIRQPRLDGVEVAHVRRKPHCLGAQRLERRHRRRDLLFRAAGHRDPRAVFGERLGDAPVDAAGPADHHHALAREIDAQAHRANPPRYPKTPAILAARAAPGQQRYQSGNPAFARAARRRSCCAESRSGKPSR